MTSFPRHSSLLTNTESSDALEVQAGQGSQAEEASVVDESITDAEANQLRQEKLAEIRRAIAAGAYDSDELLEKSLARMISKLGLD